MPHVSVILPVYNVERYVGLAVESALSQSYEDIEVIVVNDGSTDGTARALEPFMDRITYLEQSNRGVAAARNIGLTLASGEYVALLDGDDSWLPGKLAAMVPLLDDRTEFELAVCDAYLIFGDEPSTKTFYRSRPRRLRFREENQQYWIVQYNFILNPGVLCRRKAFDIVGPFDTERHSFSDWDLWLRLICSGGRACFVDQALGAYRLRSGSITANPIQTFNDELSLLEAASQREESADVSGLQGRISFVRGKKALAERNFAEASLHFRAAAADSAMPMETRIRSRLAANAPRVAWRHYVGRLSVR